MGGGGGDSFIVCAMTTILIFSILNNFNMLEETVPLSGNISLQQ